MEINMENAFYFAIKGSIGTVMSNLDATAGTIEDVFRWQIYKGLGKPLPSTFIITSTLVLLIMALTTSVLVVAGVLCIVVVILIVEGFVLGLIIGLTAAITALIFTATIIIVGYISSCRVK